ncbi:MAG: metallophosphoesterase, partial [Planctomycetaceae bacterium]
DHALIRHSLEDSGWKCAVGSGQVTQLNGISVFIGGSERPWMGSPPPDASQAAADISILLCHTPDGQKTARRLGYQLMLSGHTHGGQVVLPLVGPVYSPSFAGVRFASGLFTWPEFVLHVSRGVGSKDPLRWNCPPELTWLDVTLEPPPP